MRNPRIVLCSAIAYEYGPYHDKKARYKCRFSIPCRLGQVSGKIHDQEPFLYFHGNSGNNGADKPLQVGGGDIRRAFVEGEHAPARGTDDEILRRSFRTPLALDVGDEKEAFKDIRPPHEVGHPPDIANAVLRTDGLDLREDGLPHLGRAAGVEAFHHGAADITGFPVPCELQEAPVPGKLSFHSSASPTQDGKVHDPDADDLQNP